MKLVGYIRVSQVAGREGDTFISPKVQRERILSLPGHTIIAWHTDLDQSGARIDRPGLELAFAAVERGEAQGIAVAKLDRFARSVSGAGRAIERLEAAGGVLVAVDLGMDTSTPAGKLMRNVLMALAEFDLDRIREGWQAASDQAISRGVHITNVPPAGYRRRDDGRLELDPETAPTIRQVFHRRASGTPWRDLCRYLDESLPRADGGAWPMQTVTGIIANRAYLGEARRGTTVNRQAHPPLVTRPIWERAQMTPRLTASRKHEPALLAGLIYCDGCGKTMSRMGDGKRGYLNYRCRVRSADGVCDRPARISVRRADGFVTGAFLDRLAGELPVAIVERQRPTDVVAVEALEAAELELAVYRDMNLATVIGRDAYLDGLAVRARRVDDARLALVEPVPVTESARELAAGWPRLTDGQRRRLLAAVVGRVVVKQAHLRGQSGFDDRIRVEWKGGRLGLVE